MSKQNNIIIISTLSVILIVLLSGCISKLGEIELPITKNDYHSFTKAICNSTNYCVDVLIECNGNKVLNITPAVRGIQFPLNWTDTRPVQLINKWC